MSGSPVIAMDATPTIGWFGKLPCAGDFVHRRLPHALIESVDNWVRQGLAQLRASHPNDWQQIFRTAPMWNCAIPAGVARSGMTLVGLLAPSHDRVGREFPLCAGVALDAGASPTALLSSAHEWLPALGRIVLYAQARPTTVDAFDAAVQSVPLPASPQSDGDGDILSILNDDDVATVPMATVAHALPWPGLALQFDPAGGTSYWWTNSSGGAPPRGFTTDSGLAPALLLTLMRTRAGTATIGRR